MIVGEFVVDGHVFEEPADVVVEEALDFFEVELRVYENSTNVRFDNVGKGLVGLLALTYTKFHDS